MKKIKEIFDKRNRIIISAAVLFIFVLTTLVRLGNYAYQISYQSHLVETTTIEQFIQMREHPTLPPLNYRIITESFYLSFFVPFLLVGLFICMKVKHHKLEIAVATGILETILGTLISILITLFGLLIFEQRTTNIIVYQKIVSTYYGQINTTLRIFPLEILIDTALISLPVIIFLLNKKRKNFQSFAK